MIQNAVSINGERGRGWVNDESQMSSQIGQSARPIDRHSSRNVFTERMLSAVAESTRAKPDFTAAAIGSEIKQPRPGLSITDGDPGIEGDRFVGGNIDKVAREVHIRGIAIQDSF